MPLLDHDDRLRCDRAKMLGHALVAVDPDLPLIVIGQEESGKLYVASTHGGPVTDELLQAAMGAIRADAGDVEAL